MKRGHNVLHSAEDGICYTFELARSIFARKSNACITEILINAALSSLCFCRLMLLIEARRELGISCWCSSAGCTTLQSSQYVIPYFDHGYDTHIMAANTTDPLHLVEIPPQPVTSADTGASSIPRTAGGRSMPSPGPSSLFSLNNCFT